MECGSDFLHGAVYARVVVNTVVYTEAFYARAVGIGVVYAGAVHIGYLTLHTNTHATRNITDPFFETKRLLPRALLEKPPGG